MVACAMEVITLMPPVLCPDFLAILTLRCNPTIDQKPRQASSQPSPPAIRMVRVPIHTLYMWLTLEVTYRPEPKAEGDWVNRLVRPSDGISTTPHRWLNITQVLALASQGCP